MVTETTGSGGGTGVSSSYAVAVEIEVPYVLDDGLGWGFGARPFIIIIMGLFGKVEGFFDTGKSMHFMS